MFCRNCGTKLEDDAMFCGECGTPTKAASAPQPTPSPAPAPVYTAPAPEATAPVYTTPVASAPVAPAKKNKNILIIAALAVVAVAAFFIFGNSGSTPGPASTPKAAAEKFMNAYIDCDGAGMVACIPDSVLKPLLEEEEMTKREFIAEITEMSSELHSDLKEYLGNNYKITCSVVNTSNVDPDDKEDLIENYKDYFNVTVQDVKEVNMQLTLSAGILGTQSEDVSLYVIKVGGSWYIELESMEDAF